MNIDLPISTLEHVAQTIGLLSQALIFAEATCLAMLFQQLQGNISLADFGSWAYCFNFNFKDSPVRKHGLIKFKFLPVPVVVTSLIAKASQTLQFLDVILSATAGRFELYFFAKQQQILPEDSQCIPDSLQGSRFDEGRVTCLICMTDACTLLLTERTSGWAAVCLNQGCRGRLDLEGIYEH